MLKQIIFCNKKCHEVFAQISICNVQSNCIEENAWLVLLNVSASIIISNVDLGLHAQK
jgi:hypothetical protein